MPENDDRNICHHCVGDAYLSALIERDGSERRLDVPATAHVSVDDVSGYEKGIKAIYEQAVSSDRYLLTFENANHNAAAPMPAPAPVSTITSCPCAMASAAA